MNILIISQYYYPEQFQINEIAPALVSLGHKVTVLCGLPNYPKGKIFEGYTDPKFRHEIINGVEIIRCKQHPRGNNVFSLIRNYISYPRQATKELKKLNKRYDIVFSYQLSPITSVLPAIKYKQSHKVPLLLYCLDIWPESAKAHLGKISLFYKFISKLSKRIYGVCDRILVTSKPFISYLQEINLVPANKLGYLPQHASPEMLDMDLKAEDNGVVDFMFAGNLGAGQNLQTIVEAAKILCERNDYLIHFVGDGSKRDELQRLVKEYHLYNNFIFYGNQKRTDMPSFYKKADVLLISLRGNNAVGNTLPGKMQVYMTVGKPILGAINGATNEIIKESQCGTCVAAGDSQGLAKNMLHVIEHFEEYSECGENARKYFKEHFTLDKYIQQLDNEIKQLVSNGIQ